MKNIIFN